MVILDSCPFTMNELKKIFTLMENSVCRIEIIDNEKNHYNHFCTGFLLKLFLPAHQNFFLSLVTSIHPEIYKEMRKVGKKIQISFANNYFSRVIELDESRLSYNSEIDQITFIEVRYTDGFNLENFLELDDFENITSNYDEKDVYLLQYPYGKEICLSPGKLKKSDKGKIISKERTKEKIFHNCSSCGGSQGGPLINKINHKVVGIHRGYMPLRKINCGILIKESLEKFHNIIDNKKPNDKSSLLENKSYNIEFSNIINENNEILNDSQDSYKKKFDISIESEELNGLDLSDIPYIYSSSNNINNNSKINKSILKIDNIYQFGYEPNFITIKEDNNEISKKPNFITIKEDNNEISKIPNFITIKEDNNEINIRQNFKAPKEDKNEIKNFITPKDYEINIESKIIKIIY